MPKRASADRDIAEQSDADLPDPSLMDDPEQSARFVELARELDAEDTSGFDEALRRLLPPRAAGQPAPRSDGSREPKRSGDRTRDGR
jgi:hypothetical protein